MFLLAEQFNVFSLVYGTVIGFALQVVILAFQLIRQRVIILPRWNGLDFYTIQVLKQYLPMATGVFLMSSALLVDQAMASMLEPGSVSTLSYGNKVVTVFLGIGSMAIGTAVLPYFSQMVASKQWEQIKHTLYKYIKIILLVSVPISISIIILSEPLIRIIFERGAFAPETTLAVSEVQIFYALQIPFYVLIILFVRLISALKKNNILFTVATINLVLNILFNLIFISILGVAGIALSTSIVYCLSFIVLAIKLKQELLKQQKKEEEEGEV